MSSTNGSNKVAEKRKGWLSVDVAAVLLAIALAGLVRFGALQHISW